MNKNVITVVVMDTVGSIANVCTNLAGQKVNVLDISLTIVGGFFNMMMIVDATEIADISAFTEGLNDVGKQMNCVIHCQNEEIFNMMHRI